MFNRKKWSALVFRGIVKRFNSRNSIVLTDIPEQNECSEFVSLLTTYRLNYNYFVKYVLCFQKSCEKIVKSIQIHDKDVLKFDEIRYNFILAGEDMIFFGREWDFAAQVLEDSNENVIHFGIIGNYSENQPNSKIISTFNLFVSQAIRLKKIDDQYQVRNLIKSFG